MKGVIAVLLVAGMPVLASAAEVELNEQQKLGWRLYETSCGVCHTRPTLVAGLYGPELNKESAGGREVGVLAPRTETEIGALKAQVGR